MKRDPMGQNEIGCGRVGRCRIAGIRQGPTDDPEVEALRSRQSRSLLTTLLPSFGVPMVLGVDELVRTQHGTYLPSPALPRKGRGVRPRLVDPVGRADERRELDRPHRSQPRHPPQWSRRPPHGRGRHGAPRRRLPGADQRVAGAAYLRCSRRWCGKENVGHQARQPRADTSVGTTAVEGGRGWPSIDRGTGERVGRHGDLEAKGCIQ
jgi:hypothetical protein